MAAPPNPLALFIAQVREAYALEEHAVDASMVNNYPPGHLQCVSDDALIEYEKAILDLLYTVPAAAVVPRIVGISKVNIFYRTIHGTLSRSIHLFVSPSHALHCYCLADSTQSLAVSTYSLTVPTVPYGQ
ncbi:hypothetical protein BT96DRAFT_464124 [Gymnopus androsaceus JB14]|uniref:Uncharacterized protein n=1 Tax=Gymnopus androsaceus JB14 TaxID=1447944 RepID=A0A6A4IJB9_9AGAR|nr:hypothetical protein BT96DRAFT_464124 [Gymnopus androsaceus JB14]